MPSAGLRAPTHLQHEQLVLVLGQQAQGVEAQRAGLVLLLQVVEAVAGGGGPAHRHAVGLGQADGQHQGLCARRWKGWREGEELEGRQGSGRSHELSGGVLHRPAAAALNARPAVCTAPKMVQTLTPEQGALLLDLLELHDRGPLNVAIKVLSSGREAAGGGVLLGCAAQPLFLRAQPLLQQAQTLLPLTMKAGKSSSCSPTTKPSAASMATRACMISDSRQRLTSIGLAVRHRFRGSNMSAAGGRAKAASGQDVALAARQAHAVAYACISGSIWAVRRDRF